VPRLG